MIKMKINKFHRIGIVLGVIIAVISFLLLDTKFLFFTIGFGVIVAVIPFVYSVIRESKEAYEKEQMFLVFLI